MIHLMLTDLCRPSAEFHLLLFPVHIIVLYFYVFVSCCFSHTCKRKTSFFCFIWSIFSQHYRIKHHNINQPYIYNDHSLFDSDHICCHSHAAGTVDFQCILKIFPYRNIFVAGSDFCPRKKISFTIVLTIFYPSFFVITAYNILLLLYTKKSG